MKANCVRSAGSLLLALCMLIVLAPRPPLGSSAEDAAFSGRALTDVYFGGTEAQWKKIPFTRTSGGKEYNGLLKNAKIHFSSTMPS